jgi:hypothetical protein
MLLCFHQWPPLARPAQGGREDLGHGTPIREKHSRTLLRRQTPGVAYSDLWRGNFA